MACFHDIPPGRCVIILPKTAPAPDKLAARELASALSAMTGSRPPMRHAPPTAGAFPILLGDAAIAAASRAGLPPLAEDEVHLGRLAQPAAFLRGGGPRGLLYAVYEWLDQLGCRWFHPRETLLPSLSRLPLPRSARVLPGFEYREALWHDAVANPAWACRNRLNGHLNNLDAEHGGGWGWEPFVHSFYQIAPPDRFAETHPEYYSFRRGQGRITRGAQLCLSNPGVLKLAIEFALERMSHPGVRIVEIGINDCGNPCQCPRCASRDRLGGAHAASLIAFVNRVAEATARVHPGKFVSTSAYTYTQTPPRAMRAHPNVIVRLCHMEPSCDAHPLASCPRNRHYVDCLHGWAQIAPRVYVWHYVTNFLHYLAFHPNLDALSQDVRFYRDAGVKGVFFQAQSDRGLSFAEMHAFAQARVAWNPARDYWAEARAFLHAFYGPAGAPIAAMLDALHANARAGVHAHLYTHPAEGTFTPDQIQKASDLLRQAQDAAPAGSRFARRLDRVRLWWSYTALTSAPPIEKRPDALRVHAAPDARRLFAFCKVRLKALAPRPLHEFPASHQDIDEELGWALRSRDIPLVTLAKGAARVQIAPELAGMVCSLSDAAGQDVIRAPAPWMLRYPYIGGYTEGCSPGGFGADFWRAYAVKSRSENSVTLTADLGGGIEAERRFDLRSPDEALRITTIYANRGSAPKPVTPHGFLVLSLGQTQDIRFFVGRAGDRCEPLPASFPADGTVSAAQWVSLSGASVPRGAWGLFNHKLRLGLLHDFGPHKAVHCGSNAYWRDQRVLLEVLLRPSVLKPGQRRAFRHSLRIIHSWPVTASSTKGKA